MKDGADSSIQQLLDQRGQKVHLMGIGGVGMAGLAFLLQNRGLSVSGCDLKKSRITDWLEAQGVPVSEGHSPGHIARDTRWLIRTAATPADAPEIQAALAAGLPVHRRGYVLPALFRGTTSIAVAGTHGKTTTTTFITQLLRAVGRDPSWCIGGESETLGAVAGVGRGGLLVVEADESDGTLADYSPDIAIVTNVDADHLDHFENVEAIHACFRSFVSQTHRHVIYCREDAAAHAICAKHPGARSYAIEGEADIRAVELVLSATGSRFRVRRGADDLGLFNLPVPGRHNVLNALAAMATCLALNIEPSAIAAALATLSLPGRRFQHVLDTDNIRIITDYAHHPREIAALVSVAKMKPASRLIALFQPHRYSRTAALGSEFPAAFEGVSDVILLPVYAASESPMVGGTHWDLYEHFRSSELREETTYRTRLADSLEQAARYVQWHLAAGDTLLLVGAGNIDSLASLANQGEAPFLRDRLSDLADELSRHLEQCGVAEGTTLTPNDRIGPRTTLGVGGSADLWVDVGSRGALAEVLRFCKAHSLPFHILGAGANVLVGDLGLRGITVRLAGSEFHRLEERPSSVIVGAGVSIMRLLRWTMERGMSGYESFDGIPATIGGAVRMNAGAHGHEMCEKVLSVICMDREGNQHEMDHSQLDFVYRSCRGLGDRLVLAATFRTEERSDPETIRGARAVIREKRAHWSGLRCAGSIFKNPLPEKAWQLVDRIGYRGKRIGGAWVNPKHTNVIATEEGALASDVRALIEQIRIRVQRDCGVLLEPEVTLLD